MSKALVNYHFGGREGLIAEAMVVGYEGYVALLMQAAEAAGPEGSRCQKDKALHT